MSFTPWSLPAAFHPSLSDSANYIADTLAFRWTVGWSFVLSYLFGFASLVPVLLLLPNQKREAQKRKREWPRRAVYGWTTLGLLAAFMAYSLAVNLLSMFPSTMCLRFAGGKGC